MSDGDWILMCWEKRKKFFLLPGGTAVPGESTQACLVRELREELGIDITVGSFIRCLEWHWQEAGQAYQEFEFVFDVPVPATLLDTPPISQEAHLPFSTVLLSDLGSMSNVAPPGIAAMVAQHYRSVEGVYEVTDAPFR